MILEIILLSRMILRDPENLVIGRSNSGQSQVMLLIEVSGNREELM